MPLKAEAVEQLVGTHRRLAENATSATLWTQQAQAFLASGEADRCKQLLETLLLTCPEEISAHLLLGQACLLQGDPTHVDEAIACCRHMLKLVQQQQQQQQLQPGVELRVQAACALGVALATKARQASHPARHRAQLREEAANVMDKASASIVGAPVQARLQSLLQYNLAVVRAESGDIPAAVQHAHAALAAAQKLPASREGDVQVASCVLLLALLFSSQQQHKAATAALSLLERGTGGSVGGVSISSQLRVGMRVLVARVHAALLQAQGDAAAAVMVLDKARKDLTAAVDEGPSTTTATSQVWQELALALAKAGAVADARYCADQAMQMDPWAADSQCAAGHAHELTGQYTQAMDCYSAALAVDPHHTPSLLRLGSLLRQTGMLTQLSAARDLLSQAVLLEPGSAAAWYQLGLTCRALQHRQQAQQHLRTAIKLAACTPVLPFHTLPLLYPKLLTA